MHKQLRSFPILALAITVVVGFACPNSASAAAASRPNPSHMTKQASLRMDMRKLWEDHITWTRVFIISAAADLPDKDAATQRLLQNQVDIGNAIKPYYGDSAGDKLTALLKEHITTAADVVAAAKANDTGRLENAKTRWFANADEIAEFLGQANPKSWPVAEMKRMMHDHLNLTTTEAVARLHGDWSGDISAYDRVHEQILHMADMLSAGIISQFPRKFS